MRTIFPAHPAKQGSLVALAALMCFAITFSLIPNAQASEDDEDRAPAQVTKNTREKPASTPAVPAKPKTATAPQASKQAAAEPTQAKTKKPAAGDPSQQPITVAKRDAGEDIYGQWAQKKLDRAKAITESKVHPLAKNYPDHFVVVCEAGCTEYQAEIVYLEPRDARGPVHKAASDTEGIDPHSVACVGGCYSGNRQFATADGRFMSATNPDSWLTTSKPATPAKPARTGKRWFERINGDKSKPAN